MLAQFVGIDGNEITAHFEQCGLCQPAFAGTRLSGKKHGSWRAVACGLLESAFRDYLRLEDARVFIRREEIGSAHSNALP
ncbi:hypothetical protein GCM10007167_23390 [Vulcaniibacterium thermophilum]|uniref:Uncharacterized protein n=2 Tax=Vulcaniibacterium thermophilum TaxID=1169913 RepID=A0A918Z7L9_9GAMM|nr:hypothetical protein GCM10007167_23390 [Vulcaniibacterium thermophilum]